ncbi:MAG: hypothetical protein COA79_11925 [Planctomycetota bacterium]|nr:MAG: hypothetical protein COA79_11925 [Planctomycetota bacterium]
MFQFPIINKHDSDYDYDLKSIGLPFARGQVFDSNHIQLLDEAGKDIPVQVQTTCKWKDGSIRWCLAKWSCSLKSKSEVTYSINILDKAPTSIGTNVLSIDDGVINIDTGLLKVSLGSDPEEWFREVTIPSIIKDEFNTWSPSIGEGQLFVELEDGKLKPEFTGEPEIRDNGPICSEVYYKGIFRDSSGVDRLHFKLRLVASVNSQILKISYTLHNPRHQPREELGHFRLGLPNAAMIKDAGFRLSIKEKGVPFSYLAAELGREDHFGPVTKEAKIYQDSSGNENWFHRTDITKDWQFPQQFRGYKMTVDGTETYTGDHAGGWAAVNNQRVSIAMGVEKFWENYPKAFLTNVNDDGISITCGLFPQESKYAHELVGGEQKSHEIILSFHRVDKPVDHHAPGMTTLFKAYKTLKPKMHRLLNDPILLPSIEQLNESEVMLPTVAYEEGQFKEYENVVDCVFEDPAFDLWKLREKWADFGWRNFGDFNADYEGGGDILSHHNNEYDFSLGLLMQAMRRQGVNQKSADQFLEAGLYAAIHQADIDTYHTKEDPHGGYCYNGGKFTHTEHLIEPGRGGHRQSDSALFYGDLMWPWGIGGGPESGHYDNAGIMLAYYLTGRPMLEETALEIADNTTFKVLEDQFAQHAYYRTSAHNIACSLVGYLHTGDEKHVQAIEIILKETHPDKIQPDRPRDAQGHFAAGEIFNGIYLKNLTFYALNKQRDSGEKPQYLFDRIFFWADCMHKYSYSEEVGDFAYQPLPEYDKQLFGPDAGGGTKWFHIEAFALIAKLREDPKKREEELRRCFSAYQVICNYYCPDGKPVYHSTKYQTYSLINGHAILDAMKKYPEVFEDAQLVKP